MENKKQFELTDDALNAVSGGAAMSGQTVSNSHTCEHFVCCWCGLGKDVLGEGSHGCEAQGHGFVDHAPDGSITCIEAIFSNTCEWCKYQSRGICNYGM